METNNSKNFEFDFETLKRLGRNALIIFTPVIILFLNQIQSWTMDYKIIVAAAMSIWIDACRRYLTDYSK